MREMIREMTGLYPCVEHLTSEDLEACCTLAVEIGWPEEREKWQLLATIGELFGVRDGGRLVGAAVLTRHGRAAAAVGNVLVAEEYRRQGIGEALCTEVLRAAGGATVTLFATAVGLPLYRRLGFVEAGRATTVRGHWTGAHPAGPRTRPMTVADLPAVAALDELAGGVDRSVLISALLQRSEAGRVVETEGRITAAAIAWRNAGAVVVGPVLAPDADHAEAMVADLAAVTSGALRLDLCPGQDELIARLAEHGLERAFETELMVLGGVALPGRRELRVSASTLAIG